MLKKVLGWWSSRSKKEAARQPGPEAAPAIGLHDAVNANDLSAIEVHLRLAPESVNARGAAGETPLHRAASFGRIEAAKLLLARGADVDAQAKQGETALHLAAVEGNAELAKVLIAAGAQLSLSAEGGVTPLHLAAVTGKLEVARALVEAGAPLEVPDQGDNRALHRAAAEGHLEVVVLLLEHGADPTSRGYNGMTAESLAVLNHQVIVAQRLHAATGSHTG